LGHTQQKIAHGLHCCSLPVRCFLDAGQETKSRRCKPSSKRTITGALASNPSWNIVIMYVSWRPCTGPIICKRGKRLSAIQTRLKEKGKRLRR